MGLVTGLLLLPLAPVRGTIWIADRLAREAERQVRDPRVVQEQLAALNRAFDEGLIGEDAFEAEEDRLLDLLAPPVPRAGRPVPSEVSSQEGLS